MKKVLIPTDFSDTALNAAAYAMRLLEDMSCEFYLFHAYKVPQSVGVLISVSEILQKEVAENLEKDEKRLRELLGYPPIAINHLSLPGSFHDLLPEVIDSQEMDLIVMGTHGARGLADSILGTNTARVIGETQLPLLVVPNSLSYDTITNLVFSTDQSTEEEGIHNDWNWVDWMRDSFDARFTKLHIEDPEHVRRGREEVSYASTKRSGMATKPVPAVIAYKDVNETVYHKDVVEGILSYIPPEEVQNSLLILVAHEHGWLGRLFHQSVTQQIAMRNELPLLILHD